MAAPPPALMADLVEDILLRIPPDDPARLLRAALVCKEWCRIVSGPGFRRRFCELHRKAPILSLLCNMICDDGFIISRFLRALSCPPLTLADFCDGQALDARHGRVLFRKGGLDSPPALYVWDPITKERRELPILPQFDPCGWKWNAAVLCADGACDHLDCHGGPFLVVLLDSETDRIRVHVYSSEAEAWNEPIYGLQYQCCVGMEGTALVENSLYCLIDLSHSILKYDLATANMSAIEVPPVGDFVVLMPEERGGLGIAILEGSELSLYSMVTGLLGDATWTKIAAIQIFPADVGIAFARFAYGIGVLFVGTYEGLFSINVKCHRVLKVCDTECSPYGIDDIVPYMAFYTPDLYQYGLLPA